MIGGGKWYIITVLIFDNRWSVERRQDLFIGTYNNSIDVKNRMIVPSKYRDRLGKECILTKGIDRCLYIYDINDWENLLDKIDKLPESDPKVRAFVRHICGNAVSCGFDKQGRIIIPAELKEYAQIDKDLVTIGAMRKIEVWAKEQWDAPDNENRMDTEEFNQTLAAYNF